LRALYFISVAFLLCINNLLYGSFDRDEKRLSMLPLNTISAVSEIDHHGEVVSDNYQGPAVTFTKTDVNCYGDNSGTIDITVSGTGAISFVWSDGPAATEDRTGLPAGTYTVTVTDDNGSTTVDATIIQPASALGASLTGQTNVLCYGQATGSVAIAPSGGTSPYVITPAQTGLAAGLHTITITDSNGCTATVDATITQPASALGASLTGQTNVLCYGQSTGSVVITPSGGTSPYVITPAQTGLAAGLHTITITDSNGCTATVDATITQPASALGASLTGQTNVLCYGQSTGSVVITPSGGTSPYVITPAQTGLAAGLHTFTITDTNGCITTVDATITQPASALGASLTGQTNVLCYGQATGSVVITPSGGTMPYVITPAQTGLAAGLHTFTVTDTNGCTTTVDATITQPASALGASLTGQTNVLCYGQATGSVVITPSGGTMPYVITPAQTGLAAGLHTFTVTDTNGCTTTVDATITQPASALGASLTGQTNVLCYGQATGSVAIAPSGGTSPYVITPAQTGLAAGLHSFTVTDTNGCTTTVDATITQPASALGASLTGQTNVLCFGQATGSVVITPSGGTSPYVITPAQTGLAAGLHTFTVTDTNGCTTTVDATIIQPASALGALLTGQTNVLCYGQSTGSVAIAPSGGTSPYVITPAQTGLAAGLHTFTITDTNGCTTTVDATITQPASALGASLTGQTNVLCYGQATGSVAITPSGGTSPYVITPAQTGLAAGLHTFTVTDTNGCTTAVDATITQPASALMLTTTQLNVLCFGTATGSATVMSAGGTSSYSYSWNTASEQTTATATGLAAGNYSVIVTDADLCTSTANVMITQPAPLTINNINSNTPVCEGSSLNLAVTASGGTPGLSYTWTGPNSFASANRNPVIPNAVTLQSGNYIVSVIDGNGCQVSSNTSVTVHPTPTVLTTPASQGICSGISTSIALSGTVSGTTFAWTSALISGTATGFGSGSGNSIAQTLFNPTASPAIVTYTITPSANGCTGLAVPEAVTVNPIPAALAAPALQTMCTGGTTGIALTSSTVGVTFSWVAALTSGTATGFASGTGNNIAQTIINPGPAPATVTYTITPTANGCSGAAITAVVSVNPDATLTLTSGTGTKSQVICINTPLTNITYTIGGSGTGAIISSGALPAGVTGNFGAGVYTISGTPTVAGTFLYTLTTTGPCGQASQSGTITSYPSPTVNALSDYQLCAGITTAVMSVSGPVPGTVFNWTNNNTSIGLGAGGTGNIPSFTTANLTSAPISAQITVTPAANGCAGAATTFTITVNPAPVLNTPLVASVCSGTLFSYAPASLTTGTTFGWNRPGKAGISNPANSGNGVISETLTNLTSNPISVTYTYTLTANGCANGQNLVVTVVPSPTLTSSLNPADVCSNALFSYTPSFTISGTTATWSRAAVPNISNGAGSGTGSINETLISTSATDVNVNYVYTLNASGCINTQNITFNIKPAPVLSGSLTPPAICSNTTFSYTPASLTPGTTFTWTRAAIAGINGNLPGGGSNNPNETLVNSTANPIPVTYIYTLRAGTCQNIQSVAVIVNPTTSGAVSGTTMVCQNAANPVITFTGTGGPSPYTFTYTVNSGGNQFVSTTAGNSVTVSVPTNSLGTFIYSLVSVSNANGCPQNQSGSATVTVTSLPTATIGGTTSVCLNSAPSPLVTFTGLNGSAPYTFVYTLNGGANLSVSTVSGNSVTVTIPTTSEGSFVYSLVSVSSAAGCSQLQSGSATVTVNALPTVTIAPASASICSGSSITLTAGGATSYSWSPSLGLSASSGISVTANPLITTTYTVTGTNVNGCISTAAVVVTVNPDPAITVSPPSASICAGENVTLTASGALSYSWSPATGLSATNLPSVDAEAAVTTTYTVTGTDSNGCSGMNAVTVTVNQVPVLTSVADLGTICGGTTVSYNPASTPATGVNFTWTRAALAGNAAASGNGSINETLVNNGVNPVGINYTYTLTTPGCSVTAPVTVVVVSAPVVTVGASPSSVCAGATVNLTSSSNITSHPPILLTENFNSATVGATTGPDGWTTTNTSAGGTPANAAWTVRASGYNNSGTTFSSNDNSQFYLTNSRAQGAGGTANTTLKSPPIDTRGYNTLSLNFWHYYRDNGSSGDYAYVEVSTDGTSWTILQTYNSTLGNSNPMNQNPVISLNGYVGNANLYIRFRYTATNDFYWAIDNIQVSGTSSTTSSVSWSSNPSGLVATTANTSAVVSRTTTYTATYIDLSTNCPGSASVTVTGIPPADATITADYCSVPGMIKLTAHPGPAGFTYQWTSRPETTQSINVNIVSNYTVQVTDASTGCIGLATLPVSNELVIDGSFTNFNAASPSFFTEYTQQQSYYNASAPDPTKTGLWPEGDYAVNVSAWYDPTPKTGYHPNFHGRDHTNNTVGARNYLLVNGSTTLVSSPLRQMIIWQQTVAVRPNSDYYFSAWAMNLNPVSPAQLQFEVNGVLVGTIADLNVAPKPASEGDVALTNWVNFYSNPKWSSGAATTAVIRIRNLNTIAGGNDFGLDDISFGSLDPAPASIAPTVSGTICAGGSITLKSNVTGGKSPYNFTWTGPNGFTSADSIPVITNATTLNSGTYHLSLVDGYGCAPVTGSVSVIVNALPACSITGVNTACPNSSGNIFTGPVGMVTYSWSITNGTIIGAANGQSVTVTAGSLCSAPATLSLAVTNASCTNSCTKTVTLQDIATWTTPAGNLNRTLECSDAAGLMNAQALIPAATSSCTGGIIPVKTSAPFVPGSCPQSGSYTNTWTFHDGCGNPAPTLYTQVITITDTTPPVWTTPAASLDRSLSCTDAAGIAAAIALVPVASDDCGSPVTYTKISDITTPGGCAGTYMRVRIWTAKDNCSNVSLPFMQTIQVTDNVPPVWDQPSLALDATLECTNSAGLAAALALAPTAKDACGSGVVIFLLNDVTTAGGCAWAYTRIREWTATDGCMNVSVRYRQTIVVQDITAPTWSTPAGALDVILECSDAAGLAVAQTLFPVASDLCDSSVANLVKSSGGFVAGACSQGGSYTNSWTVTDDCGNRSAVYNQVITLQDNTAPVIIRPSDQAISCSDSSAPSATGTATATDNCDPAPVVTYTDVQTPGICSGNMTINRTWKATDHCGNSATSLQRIYIQDVDPPVITCPVSGNQSVNTNSGNYYVKPDASWNATATDGCSSYTLSATLTGATSGAALLTLTGVSFNSGVTTVTWNAADACGNRSFCSFTVTVNAGADLSVSIAALPATATLGQNLTYTVWVKNLGPSTAANVLVSETLPAGMTLVSFSSSVGVWDGLSAWTIGNLMFNDVATLTITAGVSAAHCSDFTNSVSVTSPTTDPVLSNNSATLVTDVIDATNPLIAQCPAMRVISGCSIGDITGPAFSIAVTPSTYSVFSDGMNQGIASDNCGITLVTYQDVANGSNPIVVSRSWTLSDAAGNTSSCIQQIDVKDSAPPTFNPPAPFTFCVENVWSADYLTNALKINPDPDYYLFKKGSTLLDLDPTGNNFSDNCCSVNSLVIHWRLDFTDTPNQTPPPSVLTHPSIAGTGQPSAYTSDIQIPGDGVNFTSVVHTITYWLVDCNGNSSASLAVNITVRPRPNVK